MTRSKGFVLGLVAVLLNFTAPAHAQSQKAVSDSMVVIQPIGLRVGETLMNLVQMRSGTLGTQEDGALQAAHEFGSLAHGSIADVLDVGRIYALLRCESDIKSVRPIFANSADLTVKKLDLAVQAINAALPRLSSPANVAEVTKLRDLLLEAQRALQPLIATERPK